MPNEENWRDEPLEQLLLLITERARQPEMLKLIDLPRLLEQLKPAIDVLHFGGRVIGPAEAAVLDRVRSHLDEFLQYCEGGDLPSEIMAKRLWCDVNDLCGDAVDHAQLARRQQPPEVKPCPERGGDHIWDMKDPCKCVLCGATYAGKWSEQPPEKERE